MKDRILLISNDNDDIGFCNAVAELNDLACSVISGDHELVFEIDLSLPKCIFVDIKTNRAMNGLNLFLEKMADQGVSIFWLYSPSDKLPFSSDKPSKLGFILRPYGDSLEAGKKFSIILKKMLAPTLKGREILGSLNLHVQTLKFKQVMQKGLLEVALKNALRGKCKSMSIVQTVVDTCDEILMNAFYDSNPDFVNVERGAHLVLEREIEFEISVDDQFVFAVVKDPYGTLRPGAFFKSLLKSTLTSQAVDVSEGVGAGLGLALVMRSGASVLVHVEPSKLTEVAILYDFNQSPGSFRRQFRFAVQNFVQTL